MKINTGKVIKIIALILGVIGLIIVLTLIYISVTARYTTNGRTSYVSVQTILPIFIYLFFIVTVCALIYGIGQIIVLLQTINLNLSNINVENNTKDIQKPTEILQSINSISPEITQLENENMWKRPLRDDN